MKNLTLIALLALGVSTPIAAERRGDQYDALQARRAGQAMSLREIENRILPRMGGADYLGPEFDQAMSVYRLKFVREGRVFWLDVDARTGDVIGRSGR